MNKTDLNIKVTELNAVKELLSNIKIELKLKDEIILKQKKIIESYERRNK